jgi:hypothetical protein
MATATTTASRAEAGVEAEHPAHRVHHGVPYLRFLRRLYEHCVPRSYLEIGTRHGRSLEAFDCDAICIDPSMRPGPASYGKRERTFCYQMTSDRFFETENVRQIFPAGVDVAFLDGMHHYEYLLRDFINTEKVCHKGSLILMHDCFPGSPEIAGRAPPGGAWAGDVWKLVPTLKKYRPDLDLHLIDCPPTGLFLAQKLDQESDLMQRNYDGIVAEFAGLSLEEYGVATLLSDLPVLESRLKSVWSRHLPTFRQPV